MTAFPVRQDRHPRPRLADDSCDLQPVFPGVLHPSIQNVERLAPTYFQDSGSFGRLASAIFGAAARSHLPLRQIEDTGAVSSLCHLEQCSAAGLFDVVAVGGYGKDVER